MTEREKQLRRDAQMAMKSAIWLDDEIANTVDLMLDLEKKNFFPTLVKVEGALRARKISLFVVPTLFRG